MNGYAASSRAAHPRNAPKNVLAIRVTNRRDSHLLSKALRRLAVCV